MKKATSLALTLFLFLVNSLQGTVTGWTAYVVDDGSPGFAIPILWNNSTPGTALSAGIEPNALAITPDGKTAYFVNNDSTMTYFDLLTVL